MGVVAPSHQDGQTKKGPQWGIAGDTWVVGVKMPETAVYKEFNALNPDNGHPVYDTDQGMYEDCGAIPREGLWDASAGVEIRGGWYPVALRAGRARNVLVTARRVGRSRFDHVCELRSTSLDAVCACIAAMIS